jgi:NAD(P)-dependent dehydrogenase (short-subunit alcohol dehydrogenase family)
MSPPARVINIGSITGLRPQNVPTYSYDISKAAVHHLTLKLANELAGMAITCNAIAPYVLTGNEMWDLVSLWGYDQY